ncbi:hypothetical protein ABT095_25455 [Kitasatospora sp. NPDC002227]|uniref:hypothetical protein n=1 Tax=Kitasatospora sp. NPDC002227 TaxID=3154773 RepID=UPI00333188D1
MYSYDVAAAHRPSTMSRAIPGMRPSYDAEHPSSATPIYDNLYSEYRRLFRALPGDRTGEEDLRFTGFAVRDHRPDHTRAEPQLPEPMTGHPHALEQYAPRAPFTTGYAPEPYLTRDQPGYPQHQSFHTYPGHAQGTPQYMPTPAPPAQHSNGQGWVASGYLAPAAQHAPAPTAGRHRGGMLSLPAGRVPGQG